MQTSVTAPRRRLLALALLAGMVSVLFFSLFAAPSASAADEGRDPGAQTGRTSGIATGGGDGCLLLGWEHGRSLNDIQVVSGADGALCGNPETVEKGIRALAPRCWTRRNEVFRVHWVVDASGSWATSNTNGADTALQTQQALRDLLRSTPDSMWKKPNGDVYEVRGNVYKPDMLRDQAVRSVNGDFNVLSCSWIGPTTPYICKYLDDWDDFVPALPGDTMMVSFEAADQKCHERCPDDADMNTNNKIPTGETIETYCFSGVCEAGTACPDGSDSYDWWIYAYGSEIGYGYVDNGNAGGLHPYTYYTTVSDGGMPVRGQKPFPPSMDWKYTAFGNFYNEWCTASTGCSVTGEDAGNSSAKFSRFKREYEQAVADLATENHVALDLDEAQRDAMAEGRVVNVVESQAFAYAFMSERIDKLYKKQCHFREWSTYNEETEEMEYYSYSWCDADWQLAPERRQDRHYVDYEYLLNYATPETTQAFQIVTTHCNSGEFNDLAGRPAAGADSDSPGTLSTGDATHYYSASAVSDVVNSVEDLPWGGVNSSSLTNKAKFFDRVCSFEGTLSDPATNNAISQREPGKWVYFRDGEWNPLAINYFTPTRTGVIEYDGEDPVATHLARDPKGTPDTSLMNFRTYGPELEKTDKVFQKNDADVPNQRQWMSSAEQEYLGDNVAIVPGAYTYWEAWGTWASAQRNPQVLQARWKFEPVISMITATDNVGFNNPAGAMSWSSTTVRARIAGMVESVHDSNTSYSDPTMKSRLMGSTGTDNGNGLNTPLSWGGNQDTEGRWNEDPADYNGHYYSVRWVRGVSE